MEPALAHLTIDRDLALEFLTVFSRFEYALKVSNFRHPGREAKANWITFANTVANAFDLNRTGELRDAFAYLTRQPLRCFAVENDRLDWFPFNLPPVASEAERVIRLVRQVRNNLFHGGKFARDPQSSPDHDSRLVRASLVLLRELLTLSPQVQKEYVD